MSEPRSLRSKALRDALWRSTGGKCAICLEYLGKGWHADHIDPWVATGRTNVHEMQPLCPDCNLKKGARRMIASDRLHQEKIREVALSIVAGRHPSKTVTLDAVPGGGKTGCGTIMAHELLAAGTVDQVIWAVPRLPLTSQIEESFSRDRHFNPSGFELLKTDGAERFVVTDRLKGVVVTYGALASGYLVYQHAVRARRTLLILDEVQFLAEGIEGGAAPEWARGSKALAEIATYVLCMSGTMFRHDGLPIPLISYSTADASGVRRPEVDVSYPLQRGIADGVVKPVDFVLRDGSLTFVSDGDSVETQLSDAERLEEARALRTFLCRPETWSALIDQALDHWENWRDNVYPSRMIVIAMDQSHARTIRDHVDARGISTVLAISDEGKESIASLDLFRKRQGKGTKEVLVTVAMASVGFDVKDCTHLVYLSSFRSVPWAIQAFGRIWRMDTDCALDPSLQSGFVFSPDDRRMRDIVDRLKGEIDSGIRDRESREASAAAQPPDRTDFIPVGAVPGRTSFDSTAPQSTRIEGDTASMVERIRRDAPAARGLSYNTIAEIIRAAGIAVTPSDRASAASTPTPAAEPPSVRRARLRKEVNDLATKCDVRFHGKSYGTTNAYYRARFGRPRAEWTDEQLASARDELIRRIGTNGKAI